MSKISPLAPERFPSIDPVAGVELAGRSIGLKKGGKDLMIAKLAPGTSVAGVFTRSKCPSAPVMWCRSIQRHGKARLILASSGNANAFTGYAGDAVVEETVIEAARLFRVRRNEVYVASTGVIGEVLPADFIPSRLPKLVSAPKPGGWHAAAQAIMTTDTFAKAAQATAEIGGKTVRIAGIAKGSGMIAPNMGTLLSFIFTDAKISAPILRQMLRKVADRSFNSITVDSDTSTSDTVLLCATGRGPKHAAVTKPGGALVKDFVAALRDVATDLAHQIVRDGEGATKFVTVNVSGAESRDAARIIGFAIANSPLVKTAIAGEDANWGRIVMAVGKAGERADRDALAIAIGGIPVAARGQRVEGYDETPVAQHMKQDHIVIDVDVGIAGGRATVWTCDLTHGYISINADYRS
ncbi:MAG: bifunctional glutamate N-acetyltransferase/amino-acid acetyltransferase ArgJ [Alphaproteobacteria bacterium]|nr:bifunctional glutamate N-acetyltransferase/amino-acid acetyltransferase ArgJ [Alphaproteobacteria bacterium]